jgi:hypothetical protein
MANSIVSVMEALFPQTIDKLKKERSKVDGPKPALLDSSDKDKLF